MLFPCVQCGLCCRKIDRIEVLKEYDRGDGVCHHLKNNLCEIYENRPIICNVKQMFNLFFSKTMDEDSFVKNNLVACLELAKDNPEIQEKIQALLED